MRQARVLTHSIALPSVIPFHHFFLAVTMRDGRFPRTGIRDAVAMVSGPKRLSWVVLLYCI